MKVKQFCLLFGWILLAGCAGLPAPNISPFQEHLKIPGTEREKVCAELFNQSEKRITAAGVSDNQDARPPGYPYLRVDRFLSDFRNEAYGLLFDDWLRHMQVLAMRGFENELSNLPESDLRGLIEPLGHTEFSGMPIMTVLRYCGNLLREMDTDHADRREHLRTVIRTPDAYRDWQRWAGIYPLTALAFRAGIDRWHGETLKNYRRPLADLPVQGQLIRYVLKNTGAIDSAAVTQILSNASVDSLGVLRLSAPDRNRLFAHYAPIFEIDVSTNHDRPGRIIYDGKLLPTVDTDVPVVYRHLSYTRVDRRVLLQLNYTIWFLSRPEQSLVDLLSGHLDGITWRVTLLDDGRPWVYDTIHNCGCYHLFFPTQHARILKQPGSFDESAFMPQSMVSVPRGHRAVIRVASNTHYIDRLSFKDSSKRDSTSYRIDDLDRLRSLPLPGGLRKSLYGENGIIGSSARGERFLFWPMGIPSPGAMRQWGHHATAFVGRRHFDDARLLESIFEIADK